MKFRSCYCNTATRPLNISPHHKPTVADGYTTTTRRGSRARHTAAHAHMHDHDRRCSPAVPAWCVHALVAQNSSGGVPLCVHEKIVPTSAIPPMTAKAATTLQQQRAHVVPCSRRGSLSPASSQHVHVTCSQPASQQPLTPKQHFSLKKQSVPAAICSGHGSSESSKRCTCHVQH